MFRHERPQAGRLRQFNQLGVEFFGNPDARADVEVIALLWQFFSELRLPDLTLEINSLGEAGDRPAYKALLTEFLKPRTSRLCANCCRRLDTNPLRALDCKVPECREATQDAPTMVDYMSPRAQAHFDEVLSGLTAIGIPYARNSRLVRGLDYYTLTTFEVTSPHLGAQNAVGAGGRYDGLVEALGGPATPAIGFAVGLERVSLMLPHEVIPASPRVVAIAAFGKEGAPAGLRLLQALRSFGIPSEMHFGSTTLKAHLRSADRRHAEYAIILGDDEVARGAFVLRNMRTKSQEEVPLSEPPALILTRLV